MFINCTNHSVANWGEKQKEEAGRWGEVVDYPFPIVKAQSDEEEIKNIADKVVNDIADKNPDIVLCQGEFTLTYAIVNQLKRRGIKVVAACSERRTNEQLLKDGITKKESYYEFVRFREYV